MTDTTPLDLTLAQVQQWIPGSRLVGDGATVIARVHTDTRTLAHGDLFVALKGERFDANEFLSDAKAQGAVAAIARHGLEAAHRRHRQQRQDHRHADDRGGAVRFSRRTQRTR
jgi:UDP-N-acetylmuramoyl-tripeptide--D-alanyl-D-alanine ligase